MNNFKYKLLNNWHLMRIVRLVIGAWLGILAIKTADWIPGLLGAFLLWQAVADSSCCATSCCGSVRDSIDLKSTANAEIEYEEVK